MERDDALSNCLADLEMLEGKIYFIILDNKWFLVFNFGTKIYLCPLQVYQRRLSVLKPINSLNLDESDVNDDSDGGDEDNADDDQIDLNINSQGFKVSSFLYGSLYPKFLVMSNISYVF